MDCRADESLHKRELRTVSFSSIKAVLESTERSADRMFMERIV
jgi:hypothetical protein